MQSNRHGKQKKWCMTILPLTMVMGMIIAYMGIAVLDRGDRISVVEAKEAEVAEAVEQMPETTDVTEGIAEQTAVDVDMTGVFDLALFEDTPEEQNTGMESTKEIVNGTILGSVPAADYSFSFDGSLDNAVAVRREGDVEGFNEGTYPVADAGITPQYVAGMEGQALYLDGSYGVELTGIEGLADSYTISFWFRAEELCDWSPFFLLGSNLLDAGVSQNYISFNKKTTEEGVDVVPIFNTVNCTWGNSCEIRPCSEDTKQIDLGQWNYLTICVDGTQLSETDQTKVMGYLYLNSELIGSGEVSKLSLEEENMYAYVGINCYDRLFRSCYDEIHIWNSLLNENQISAMYAAYQKSAS